MNKIWLPYRYTKKIWLPYRVKWWRDHWCVYRYEKTNGGETGTKVATYDWEPTAKKEAYRLNGEYLRTGLPF